MKSQQYKKLIDELTEHRRGISKGKRRDYTRDNEDVLKNFKNQGEALDISPEKALAVHMEKQFAAILTYIKTDGDSESEPIKNRISDCLNYLELLWGLLNDDQVDEEYTFQYKIGDQIVITEPKGTPFGYGEVAEIEYIREDGLYKITNADWTSVLSSKCFKLAMETGKSFGI